MASVRFTSLIRVEERLLEAEYFAEKLQGNIHEPDVGYYLNAFLSSARSVTFLLQKEMSGVPDFVPWWETHRQKLARDEAAKFFLNLRNFSQKQGPIALVGAGSPRGRWAYCFAGNAEAVPSSLLHRPVWECCREHVSKLASIILDVAERFPFSSCMRTALTPDGMKTLGLTFPAIEEVLGFPTGWTDVDGYQNVDAILSILREHVDGVDFAAIQRLAKWTPPVQESEPLSASEDLSERMLLSLVPAVEAQARRACE